MVQVLGFVAYWVNSVALDPRLVGQEFSCLTPEFYRAFTHDITGATDVGVPKQIIFSP